MHQNDTLLAYRVNEAAFVLGISRSTIYKLIRANRLQPVKIGRRVLIPRAQLEMLVSDVGKFGN